jgi:outer membrane biosynthesis protein TonB
VPARVVNYSTTLPSRRIGWRRGLAYTASGVLHVVLLVLILLRTSRQNQAADRQGPQETVRPVQLAFAPPRPAATPRPPRPEAQPQQPLPPPIPIAPGPDKDPGSKAQVNPTPEDRPNAQPNTNRTEATRPDPGDADQLTQPSSKPPANIASPSNLANQPTATLESEAQRIFGRPSSKLGPVSGSRDNRPWESPVELSSRGCTVSSEEEKQDPTLPPGMGMVSGKIYDERTGKPLADARLQILGTQYGAFANENGEYRLLFDRKLVDRCRSQSVRVSAPGYPSRDVLLYIGATPNGDVPLSRF